MAMPEEEIVQKENGEDLTKAQIITEDSVIKKIFSSHIPFFSLGIFFITIVFLFLVFVLYLNWNKKQIVSVVSPIQNASETKNVKNLKTGIDSSNKEVIGFLPSWAAAQNTQVNVKDFTQIIYFGLGVNPNGDLIKFNEENKAVLEWEFFTSDYFTTIRKEASASGTKVLVSIKNFDNESIDTLISNKTATANFISKLLTLVAEYRLDGVNLDFEYVTDSDFPTAKYLNTFLVELINRFKKENNKLIVSVDVGATSVLSDKAYDMVKIGEVVDEVILMAYDYRTQRSTVAGPVAPLYAPDNQSSIDKSFMSMVGRVPLEKIIVAVPLYGYEWQTINKKFGSQTVQGTGALATYKRVQELISNRDDVVISRDEKSQSPWLYYTQSGAIKQIYYEDEKSIAQKLQYVRDHKAGGIAVWALGYEGNYTEILEGIKRK